MKFGKTARASESIVDSYRDAWRQSLADWVNEYQTKLVQGYIYWRGLPVLQTPQDLWVFQEIIMERKPEVIIEIGSLAGGLTQYLADLLLLLGGDRRVVSVDMDRRDFRAESPLIHCVTGMSEDEETVSQVSELCRDRSTMVIHDGNHRAENVYRDLEAYGKMVSIGQYFIVSDGIIDLFKDEKVKLRKAYPGPLIAVEHFLKQTKVFRPDFAREKFVLTYNPNSFLERFA